MNRTHADAMAKLLAELFTTATAQQVRTFRDALVDPVKDAKHERAYTTATPADVEAAMRAQVIRSPFASDAIVAVFARLREEYAARHKPRSLVDVTQDMRDSWRRDAEKVETSWQHIDADLDGLSADDLLALRRCVVADLAAHGSDIVGIVATSNPSRRGLARSEVHRAIGRLWERADQQLV